MRHALAGGVLACLFDGVILGDGAICPYTAWEVYCSSSQASTSRLR